jgi:hypothetical protein
MSSEPSKSGFEFKKYLTIKNMAIFILVISVGTYFVIKNVNSNVVDKSNISSGLTREFDQTPTPEPTVYQPATPEPTVYQPPTPEPTIGIGNPPTPAPTTPAPIRQQTLSLNGITQKIYKNLEINNPENGVAVSMRNCKNLIFEYCVFKICDRAINMIYCDNITIRNCIFEQVGKGVYPDRSQNIKVEYCSCINIQSVGNFVQFNTVSGSDNYIRNNYVYNESGKSSTEDVINLYKSNGTENGPIIVENNYIYGGGPSLSGTGICVADNGGSYQIIRNNILIDPGQVGIGVAGGENIIVSGNQVYGKQQSFTNVGIYVWKQIAPVSNNITIENNRVGWINRNGIKNSFWDGKNTTNLVVQNNTWNLPYQVVPKPDNVGVQNF